MTVAARTFVAPVLRTRAAELSAGERALLSRIAERSRDGGDMTSGAVFEAARDYFPIGKTTYHEHLNRLAETGIIDLVPGTGRGRGRAIRLRYDPEDVAAACSLPDKTGSLIP